MKARAALTLLILTASIAIAYQIRAAQQPAAPASLTNYVPQDALLTIESPDFSALLHQWTNSAESKSWLSSDNYSVFQNSRLFGRLNDAQTSFATAAGIPTGVDLLNHVAGKQSVFAWYDIGKLEFLYITRMPADQADRTQIFQARSTFQRHHAGNSDFYIRTSGGDYGTVAFARVPGSSGDLVLLATREDLIANALKLIAAASPANSVRQEPWFRDVSAALPAEKPAPVLHMVLNLDRIVVDPHFRSYWIQRNITWTRQFRAAASDLYVESGSFREERVLLPSSNQAPTASLTANLNLATLAALVPPATGVYRVVATQNPSIAITAIQEKLLGSYAPPPPDPEYAPNPDLQSSQAGSAADLEIRIDTPPPVSASVSTDGLVQVFHSTAIDAVLTVSSAQTPAEQGGPWVPIRSAVVLHTASPANPQDLASALQQMLRGSLTTASLGINFQSTQSGGASTAIYALTGPRPLFFAISSTAAQGNLILLADDQTLLSDLLHNLSASSSDKTTALATSIAVFNHSSQRAPYLRLTSLIDGTINLTHDSRNTAELGQPPPSVASTPTFFARNLSSLSDTFASLQSERVVERTADSNLRQTVTYRWEGP